VAGAMTDSEHEITDTRPDITFPGSQRRVERSLDELLRKRLARRNNGSALRRQSGLDEIYTRLETFLSRHSKEKFVIRDLRRMSGGGANELYSFKRASDKGEETLVLRVKASGACCETHVAREFQMMQLVQNFLPAATPYLLAPDDGDFGAPAMICGFVPGIQAPPQDTVKATGMGIVYGEKLRRELAPQFVRYEAMLHSHDWSASALSLFDIPRPGTTDAIDWRLAFWDRVWDEDRLEEHPTMLLARNWLWTHRPVGDHVSLLHGDYRNGNFLFDLGTGKITAILDWELCSLGDRHADLAYTMLRAWGSTGDDGVFLNAALMDTEGFIRQYEAVSGLSVDPVRLHYYTVLALYWSAVALLSTAIRNAEARLTQLDVMYNFIAGAGGYAIGELNRLIVEAGRDCGGTA